MVLVSVKLGCPEEEEEFLPLRTSHFALRTRPYRTQPLRNLWTKDVLW